MFPIFQLKLYEDFSKSQARKNIDDSVQSENDEKKSSGHIFQVSITSALS